MFRGVTVPILSALAAFGCALLAPLHPAPEPVDSREVESAPAPAPILLRGATVLTVDSGTTQVLQA